MSRILTSRQYGTTRAICNWVATVGRERGESKKLGGHGPNGRSVVSATVKFVP